jgi:hypothetical protein
VSEVSAEEWEGDEGSIIMNHTHTHTHTCIYKYVYICICIMYMYMYMYIYIYTSIYMYVYICTATLRSYAAAAENASQVLTGDSDSCCQEALAVCEQTFFGSVLSRVSRFWSGERKLYSSDCGCVCVLCLCVCVPG